MTEKETWLFTDYTVQVDRWMTLSGKNDATVLVSDSGGTVVVGGRRIRNAIGPVPLFTLHDTYVMALSRLQTSPGYKPRIYPSLNVSQLERQLAADAISRVDRILTTCGRR
jgi:hypothetical protein